jgi:hypothetical protein
VVINIRREENGHKIFGVFKQCIHWVDTLNCEEGIMWNVVLSESYIEQF